MEQEEIIALFEQRQEAAVRETEKCYQAYLMKIAVNILNDEQTARECVNDTYLKAWNAIPPEHPKYLNCFLVSILRHICIDRYRKEHTEKRKGSAYAESLDELEDVTDRGKSPADATEEQEVGKAIGRFLQTVSKKERCAFLMRYYYADKTEDIAQCLHLSPNAVRQMLLRVRRKCKEYLIREGYYNE